MIFCLGFCGKNKLDVCMFLCRMVCTHDEHTAMAKGGNECQPTIYMSLHGNIAAVVCCAEVLFQTRFSLCCLTRCLRNLSHPTRCLWYGRTGTKHADHDGTWKGRPLARRWQLRVTQERQAVSGESDGLNLGKDPWTKIVRVLRLGFVSGRKLHVGVFRDI